MKLVALLIVITNMYYYSLCYDVTISIVEGNYEIQTFKDAENIIINSASIDNLKAKFDSYFTVSGKILDVKSEENFVRTLKLYDNLNSKWILMINNQKNYNDIFPYISNTKKITTDKGKEIKFDINGVFYDKNLIIEKFDKSTPAISLISETYNEFLNYNIESEKANIFTIIKVTKSFSSYQSTVTIILCSFFLATSIGLASLLYYKLRSINPTDTELYRNMNWLYVIQIINLIFFLYITSSFSNDSSSPIKYYTMTILSATDSIYKAFLWFYIILLSYGWKSYYSTFSREDCKWLIFLFIFIYLMFSLDFIINSFYRGTIIGNLTIVDIKTIIFTGYLAGYGIFCLIRGLRKLNVRNFNIKMRIQYLSLVGDSNINLGSTFIKLK